MKTKRFISLLVLIVLIVTLVLPEGVQVQASMVEDPAQNIFSIANGDITVSAGSAINIVYNGGVSKDVVLGTVITIIGTSNTNKVVVDGTQANITLNDANIQLAGLDVCPFSLKNGANVTLTLEGTNTLTGGVGAAGLEVGSGQTLEIKGSGSLTAKADKLASQVHGDPQGGAGIGGNRKKSAGTITLSGGIVTATGGFGGAGIGGGSEGGDGGTITVLDGSTVTAIGGFGAAGIGGGSSNYNDDIAGGKIGDITISGGTINTTGGSHGAGIGSGMHGLEGSIHITGGNITATGGDSAAGIGYGYRAWHYKNKVDQSNTGSIQISNGQIVATGGAGDFGGAGIGGGVSEFANIPCSPIDISGGTITAVGKGMGNGIGANDSSKAGPAIISGGTIEAIGGSTSYNSAEAINASKLTIGALADIKAISRVNAIKTDSNTLEAASTAKVIIIGYSDMKVGTTNTSLYLEGTSTLFTSMEPSVEYKSIAYTVSEGTYRVETGGKVQQYGSNYNYVSDFVIPSTPGLYTFGDIKDADYAISGLSDQTLTPLVKGYASGIQEATTISIGKDGSGNLYHVTTALTAGDVDAFEITQPQSTTINSSVSSSNFAIKAKDGLALGTYEATVTVTADHAQSITFQVKQKVQTYSIDTCFNRALNTLTQGYASGTQETATISIDREVAGSINNLAVSLSGSNAEVFQITPLQRTNLDAANPSTSFDIKVKDGLQAGTYKTTVTVTGDNMETYSFRVMQTVNEINDLWSKDYDTTLYNKLIGADYSSLTTISISSAKELAAVLKACNEQGVTFYGKTIVLEKDIDLKEHAWEPIGFSMENVFSGNFDGGNHTISNMVITNEFEIAGLFGIVKDEVNNTIPVISNIKVEGEIRINGNVMAAGGIAGFANYSCFNNCISSIKVDIDSASQASACIGGIVGFAMRSEFEGCSNLSDSSIIATSYNGNVGGILGYDYADGGSESSSILNSANYGSVNMKYCANGYGAAGGIVGKGNYTDIINCNNTGAVNNDYGYSSGIAGYYSTYDGVIRNCYSTGEITSCLKSAGIASVYYSNNPDTTVSNDTYLVGSADVDVLNVKSMLNYMGMGDYEVPEDALEEAKLLVANFVTNANDPNSDQTAEYMKSSEYKHSLNQWGKDNSPIATISEAMSGKKELTKWINRTTLNNGYPVLTTASPWGLIGVMPTSSFAVNGKITGVTTEMEYKHPTDTAWTAVAGTMITGLSVGKYQVRYKEGNYSYSGPGPAWNAVYNASNFITVTVPLYSTNQCDVTTWTVPSNPTVNGLAILKTVDNSTINLTVDVIISNDASWSLYSDLACTNEITNKIMTLSVGANTAYVKVVSQNGTSSKTYTITITRNAFTSNQDQNQNQQPIDQGKTDQPIDNDASSDKYVEILVNDTIVDAGIKVDTVVKDKTITTVSLDEKIVNEKIATEGKDTVITIPITHTSSDVLIGELNGQMIKNLEKQQAIIEITTDTATYTLPASRIDIDAVSKQLGKNIELKDIIVTIEIAKTPAETVKLVENSANKGKFTVVAPPVEFNVRCTYDKKTIDVSKFNDYVERTVAIPAGISKNKITTGVVVAADGTLRHVPTKIIIIDGVYYAKINSLTNSTYAVIWNPITYKDVTNSPAKKAINDLGSRMVISSAKNDLFRPKEDITRAEFVAMLVTSLGLTPGTKDTIYTDVKLKNWYCKYIEAANEYGIISGSKKAKFRPNDKITMEEATTMLTKAMTITGLKVTFQKGEAKKLLNSLGKSGQSKLWADNSMAVCMKAGIISVKNKQKVSPKDKVTRAQIAVMIRNLLLKSNLI